MKTTAFFIILAAYIIYAGIFIFRTSFVIDGERYYSLFDDAMISMRYAKNLSDGHGLVWNPGGERVEGFTNPLWVFYMSIFHFLPIPPSKISLFIQISGAFILIANLFFVLKIAASLIGRSAFFPLAAVFLTAFYLPLNNWALQGMEVGLLTLMVSASIWKALQVMRNGEPSFGLFLLLGVSTLVRMDMAVFALTVIVFLAISDVKNRRFHLKWGVSLLVAFLAVWTIFRIFYYGDALPNTYYLKMTGYPIFLRITRGLSVTWDFIARMSLPVFLIPFVLLLWRRGKRVLLLFWVFLIQVAYSIYVGGDAWEYWGGSNRYVSIVMPLFFVLFCVSLAEAEKWLSVKIGENGQFTKMWTKSLVTIVLLIALVKLNVIYSPNPTLQEWLLLKPPLAVADNKKMVQESLLLKEITDPEATIAVVWAGAIPYFSDRQAVDMLGKNDRIIARRKIEVPDGTEKYTAFYPGHMKWDYSYSITELKPDVIVQLYGVTDAEIDPVLATDYWKILIDGFVLHMRTDSRHIDWNIVNVRGQK